MPDDDRLPLKFFRSNILKSDIPWGLPTGHLWKAKQPFERELDRLCQFDTQLREQKSNDFAVVDFDSFNNSRIYRLGEKAQGPELLVRLEDSRQAPWSRIMYVKPSPLPYRYPDFLTGQPFPRSRCCGQHQQGEQEK